jgi:hypothetical protein
VLKGSWGAGATLGCGFYTGNVWQACVYLTLTHARACAGTLLARIRRCLADLHVDLLTVRPSGSQLLCAFDAGGGYDPVYLLQLSAAVMLPCLSLAAGADVCAVQVAALTNTSLLWGCLPRGKGSLLPAQTVQTDIWWPWKDMCGY